MTARQMVSSVKELASDWKYDVVSIGYPGPSWITGRRPNRTIWAAVGWDSTSPRRSSDQRRSSTMQQCRRSAAIRAAECYSSAWGPGSARP